MLHQRLTKQIRVVSIYDDALIDVNDAKMRIYVMTRDISDIQEELDNLTEKPTYFHVAPLRADKEYLMDGVLSSDTEASWNIFRHHVKKADNFQRDDGSPIIVMDDNDIVDRDCRDLIPRDIVQEIASVIVHKANESTKPFTMPDTWLATRIRSRALSAERAKSRTASEQDTK